MIEIMKSTLLLKISYRFIETLRKNMYLFVFLCSFIANFALNVCDSIINHNGVLLQPHLFLLELHGLLFQECGFIQVGLLEFSEIFL